MVDGIHFYLAKDTFRSSVCLKFSDTDRFLNTDSGFSMGAEVVPGANVYPVRFTLTPL